MRKLCVPYRENWETERGKAKEAEKNLILLELKTQTEEKLIHYPLITGVILGICWGFTENYPSPQLQLSR